LWHVVVGLVTSPWGRRYSVLKRIVLLFTAAAFMVVLVAATLPSPAFAGRGYGLNPTYKWCGGPQCDETWGCGNSAKHETYCDK
jgi:hypothetical protein